jgi:hypothetical protein
LSRARPDAAALSFACALWLALSALCSSAEARVERFAVVIGNNRGAPGEEELRFAESDARRVHEVLMQLGGFEPANSVLLTGSDAETARRTLVSVNERVRYALELPRTEVVLLVYYSGHADAEALHLGSSKLAFAEFAQLVRGSAASFRLLVVDACQAGALTRKKGGRIAPPFAVPGDDELAGKGVALLTASAVDEDAQESDELGASFFTHAFVSGLLGAADVNRDGSVVLEEAYQYAYASTLRTTSRTLGGTQHPAFSYELHGQGQIVLTRPAQRHADRGTLRLPVGAAYLVFRDGRDGGVVAEVGAEDAVRSLSLPAGRYFVRGRATDHLLEGTVSVAAERVQQLDASALTRVEYAHLLRKGGGSRSLVHDVELGARVRSVLPNAADPCWGGFAGYALNVRQAVIRARAGVCVSHGQSDLVEATTYEYDFGVRAGYVWDLTSWLSLELGPALSLNWWNQRFTTRGLAPARWSLGGAGELALALAFDVPRTPLYVAVDGAAQLYVLRMEVELTQQSALRAEWAQRGSLALGRHF